MVAITIREYGVNDWDEVEEMILNAENFGYSFLDDEKKRITVCGTFPEFGQVLVVENAATGRLVGYAVIEFRWRALVIMSFITHHKFLQQGIGRQLIERIKTIGENHPEVNVIRVDTGDFMEYAQKFYLACGFQICGFVSHDLSWFNHQVHFVYPLKGVEKTEDSQ
ncbi:MAG: GNAT family N-acetyltransferase [Candidatus Hodarchaeales archaeon]|jgi:ribosomal protein S18 acetylase RimI-like enzyme